MGAEDTKPVEIVGKIRLPVRCCTHMCVPMTLERMIIRLQHFVN